MARLLVSAKNLVEMHQLDEGACLECSELQSESWLELLMLSDHSDAGRGDQR